MLLKGMWKGSNGIPLTGTLPTGPYRPRQVRDVMLVPSDVGICHGPADWDSIPCVTLAYLSAS
jgi:hypothetical protein